jgi:hypothetical protein
MHDNLYKVAAHNMAEAARSSAATDALADPNGHESASRGLSQQRLKSRVCRYFSKSGNQFLFLLEYSYWGARDYFAYVACGKCVVQHEVWIP